MQFWSYRDPAVDATLARYERAAEWLGSLGPRPRTSWTGYIVSVVASHDAPQKPRQLARRQDSLHFAHRPEGWRDKIRPDARRDAEKVRALAPALAELPERRAICVFGGREKIEASGSTSTSST